MASLKSQPFIKAMSIDAGLVSCQLNRMRAALSGTFHYPSHHLAADPLALKSLIHSDRLDLGSQSALEADRG
jgi:hypothetical protein